MNSYGSFTMPDVYIMLYSLKIYKSKHCYYIRAHELIHWALILCKCLYIHMYIIVDTTIRSVCVCLRGEVTGTNTCTYIHSHMIWPTDDIK